MAKSIRSIYSSNSTGTTTSGGGGGIVATGGGVVNTSPIIPLVTPFTLTPENANATVTINCTPTTGIKFFNIATLKLPEIFDGESKSINLFNKKISERAKQSGWMEAGVNIIMIIDSTGTPRNLITEYGRLTVETLKQTSKNS